MATIPMVQPVHHRVERETRKEVIDLSIIIVSWNVRHHLSACLDSILRHHGNLKIEITVVDNASDDDTANMIETHYPWVRLIANGENVGFAAANNQGLVRARGRYMLLLNPDTEVQAECLEQTIQHAERHPELGIVGCRVFRPDGEQQSTMFRCLRLRDVLVNTLVPNRLMRRLRLLGRSRYIGADLDRPQIVEVIAGCFMLIRPATYEQAGGLDEEFFMYGEEAEWCHRIRQIGWKMGYFPGASILHHGGVSAGQCPDEMNLAMARSQLLLMQRTQGRWAAYVANVLMLLRDGMRVIALIPLSLITVRSRQARWCMLRQSAARFCLHSRGLLKLDWSR